MLVFGGSQGARSINTAALEAFAGARFHVLHAAGERDIAQLPRPGPDYDLRGYIDEFRGGADRRAIWSSRARAARSSRSPRTAGPPILIPYPHATADHQTANARFMDGGCGGRDPR